MAKIIKTKSKGSYALSFPNGKILRFKDASLYSRVNEVIAKGRFSNPGEMFDAAKKCANGFEFAKFEKKVADSENDFNQIDFEG